MIKLKDISRIYRLGQVEVTALSHVNLEIEEGEFIAVTGASGSGKSTLLHILGLLDRPTQGSYLFGGRDVSSLADDERTALRSRAIGFIFQQFSLLPRTTAEQNVLLPLMYSGSFNGVERARELLAGVGLSERRLHFPNQLSGGQQQRVAIARALVNRPRVILADEPTGNLDSSARDEILAIFKRLHADGYTVIIVTHEEEISRAAERIVRFRDGKIIDDRRVISKRGSRNVVSEAEPSRKVEKTFAAASATASSRGLDAVPARGGVAGPRAGGGDAERRRPLTIAGVTFEEFAEQFRQALIMLRAHRMRSFLSMLGVLIGVACLMTMLSIGQGAQAEVAQQLSSLGSNLLMVRPGPENVRGAVRLRLGEVADFTTEDIEAIRQAIPNVERVAGLVSKYSRITYKNKNWSTEISGVSPEYIGMLQLDPTSGRIFTEQEDIRRERLALLGPTVYRELFGGEDPIGKAVRIDRLEFRVLGVLAEKGSSTFRDRDDIVLIPLRTAMTRLKGSRYVDNIHVEASSSEDTHYVSEAIKDLLKKRHRQKQTAGEGEPFHVRNMADVQQALSSSTRIFSMLLGSVAAVSLLVGGIGIMNVMLVSVTERTREIGIRKAVGARSRDVLSQFLVESTVLSLFGGVGGIILGVFFSWLVARLAAWPVLVSIQGVAIGFLFSAVLGIGFGVWPAFRASRLDPIESLRYE